MKDRETAQEKLEYEIFSEQCFEQAKEEEKKRIHCEGIDCAWCGEKEPCIYKIANELEEKLLRKTQECEELKKWKKEHLKDVEFIERNPVIDILNSMADNVLLEQRNSKLKQTLAEIKEIAEKQCNICEELTPIDEYKDCKKCWQGKILQKISEVEK